MDIKEIKKDFILSNSEVNNYGFKLLTSGYKADEFKKNPIGYYMHYRDLGVVLRWNNLRIEGDNVVGNPIINLVNARGAKTATEIENGFLNAASMGGIVVLNHVIEGDVLTVTEWYNKECSLVDVPGNKAAVVQLFDRNDNELKLADLLSEPLIAAEKTGRTDMAPARGAGMMDGGGELLVKNTNNGDKILDMDMTGIKLTAETLSLLNLKDSATSQDIGSAIKNLADQLTAANTALETFKKETTAKEVADLLDKALGVGKITAATSEKLKATYVGKPTELKDLLDTMQPYKSVTEQLQTAGSGAQDLSGKTWDELDKAGKLPELKDKNLALYKLKFKEQFGVEPK